MPGKTSDDVKPQILGERPAGYAGDVSVEEAWRVLSENPNAVLVDVRTRAEWSFVGVPDLGAIGKEPLLAEWQVFPSMSPNPSFAADVGVALGQPGKSGPVFFLCRSGARSKAAAIALTGQGFTQCYNIVGGCEGDPDEGRHRGHRSGWKALGFPWMQS